MLLGSFTSRFWRGSGTKYNDSDVYKFIHVVLYLHDFTTRGTRTSLNINHVCIQQLSIHVEITHSSDRPIILAGPVPTHFRQKLTAYGERCHTINTGLAITSQAAIILQYSILRPWRFARSVGIFRSISIFPLKCQRTIHLAGISHFEGNAFFSHHAVMHVSRPISSGLISTWVQ